MRPKGGQHVFSAALTVTGAQRSLPAIPFCPQHHEAEEFGHTKKHQGCAHTAGRLCKGTERGHPSTSQGERPHQNQICHTLILDFQPPELEKERGIDRNIDERETSISHLLHTPHWECAHNQGTCP
uniref:Uncharacterized protein n=1 Tax=Pipistrellus kuhlii TaxID=59472 RepID=A0A7J8B222_PIPKU|nr:hypothetical protein mPipKuh1_007892 [Pipistrellus kuhlii]